MTPRDIEYGIRQDVKNKPIVREVDRGRLVEMWRWAGVLVFLGAVLVFSVWQQFQVLRLGYEIEETRRQKSAEQSLRRQLELQREVLMSPARLERLAHDLRLETPVAERTIVIERVPPTTPPARSVVAKRQE